MLTKREAKQIKAAFDRRGKAEYGEGYYLWKNQIHDVIDNRTERTKPKGAKRGKRKAATKKPPPPDPEYGRPGPDWVRSRRGGWRQLGVYDG